MNNIEKLRNYMKNEGIDSILVYDELNQHYLSKFAFTDGLLLITMQSAYLVTDFRYYEMALKSADKVFTVVMPESRRDFINQILVNDSCKTVGFEGGSVSFERYHELCSLYSAFEFVSIGNVIEELRQIKTPEELQMMEKAQIITDNAFSHILNILTPEMTEIDVAVELEYAMRKGGASEFAFETIAVSGDASALPHGKPRNIKLKPGFLTMDFGAKYDGYCSDMTRTVVIGKADDEMKKLYNTVLKAQLAAIDFLEEGKDAAEADKVARDIIDVDYKGTFGHSLGHSVGLFIHEQPSLSSRAGGRLLRSGEVLTVEPGIYIFGKYGCRIEDMVAIKPGGVHNFTKSTKDLIEIL